MPLGGWALGLHLCTSSDVLVCALSLGPAESVSICRFHARPPWLMTAAGLRDGESEPGPCGRLGRCCKLGWLVSVLEKQTNSSNRFSNFGPKKSGFNWDGRNCSLLLEMEAGCEETRGAVCQLSAVGWRAWGGPGGEGCGAAVSSPPDSLGPLGLPFCHLGKLCVQQVAEMGQESAGHPCRWTADGSEVTALPQHSARRTVTAGHAVRAGSSPSGQGRL